jgi:hypothetical protein
VGFDAAGGGGIMREKWDEVKGWKGGKIICMTCMIRRMKDWDVEMKRIPCLLT